MIEITVDIQMVEAACREYYVYSGYQPHSKRGMNAAIEAAIAEWNRRAPQPAPVSSPDFTYTPAMDAAASKAAGEWLRANGDDADKRGLREAIVRAALGAM